MYNYRIHWEFTSLVLRARSKGLAREATTSWLIHITPTQSKCLSNWHMHTSIRSCTCKYIATSIACRTQGSGARGYHFMTYTHTTYTIEMPVKLTHAHIHSFMHMQVYSYIYLW